MENPGDVTVVVPIRKGSTRVKGKNLRDFTDLDGSPRTLLHWKLDQLLEFLHPSRILVSSDWDLALEVASGYGVNLDERPDWLAESDAPFEELIYHCSLLVETEFMGWAPVTSPFISPFEMRNMCFGYIQKVRGNGGEVDARGMLAAHKEYSYIFMGGRPLNFPVGKGHIRTQEIQPLQICNWAFSVRETSAVTLDKYMFSHSPYIYDIDSLANLDINEELDFLVAKSLVDIYNERLRNVF